MTITASHPDATSAGASRSAGERPPAARRDTSTASPVPISYVLPIKVAAGDDDAELAGYLRWLVDVVDDLVVVDGSAPEVVARRRAQLAGRALVLVPEVRTAMGKVGGVLTGLAHARHDKVIIADDDVRYTAGQLVELARRLDDADCIRPQNHFDPLPWHARFDTARILVNRALGGDWPGTLAVRRDLVLDAGGYAGDALFENLELVRTVRAAGGRHVVALDIAVLRRPPTTAHFWRQQVRQAYDELARPWRLVAALLALPATAVLVARRRWTTLASVTGSCILVAEVGRQRAGGRRAFPASSTALAPVWVLWRSLCTYVAVGSWFRGGVRYRDTRLRRAATPLPVLRRRLVSRSVSADLHAVEATVEAS